jgi:hypothetical protein
MPESEKDTEKYLVAQIEALGGLCRKYVSPGVKGVPDRLCLIPSGKVIFVELKSEGEKITPMQEREFKRLNILGFTVYTCSTKAEVDYIIRIIKGEENGHSYNN